MLPWLIVAALVAVVAALSLALVMQRDLHTIRGKRVERLVARHDRLYDLSHRWLDEAAAHRTVHGIEHDGADYAGGLIDAAAELELALDDGEDA